MSTHHTCDSCEAVITGNSYISAFRVRKFNDDHEEEDDHEVYDICSDCWRTMARAVGIDK